MNAESELPEGWASVLFPDICKINPQKPPRNSVPFDTLVTFVPMPAVDAEKGAITDPETRKIGDVRNGFTFFQDGDVIFAKITPCMENGKAAVASNLLNGMGFGSTEFFSLRSNGAVLPEYLYHYIRQKSFRKYAEENMTGSVGQKRVPKHFIEGSNIPLPPLAEQRRIVAVVEALLARVNASRERLDRVPGLLKAFRQAVLAAAYDGRLTENWRTERQFSWSKIAIEKCGKWVGGATPSKAQDTFWVNGIIPWVTPKDMKKDFILDSIDHITQRAVNESNIHLYPEGTVIFVVRGMILARDFPVAIMNRPFTINQDIRGVIPNEQVNGHFLMYMLKHDRNKILGLVKYSTHGTKRIESPDLKSWIIPLPPLPEQHEIVRRVESLFALTDRIEQRVAAGRERADRLTQAILAKAFRGELVPTEAELARIEGREYEPAGVLLERIRRERESQGKGKPRKRRSGVED